MHARAHEDFAIAFGDLGFAAAVLACGLFNAPAVLTGLAAGAVAAY